MATYVVLMQGPSIEEAEAVLYSEDAEGIAALMAALNARTSNGITPKDLVSPKSAEERTGDRDRAEG